MTEKVWSQIFLWAQYCNGDQTPTHVWCCKCWRKKKSFQGKQPVGKYHDDYDSLIVRSNNRDYFLKEPAHKSHLFMELHSNTLATVLPRFRNVLLYLRLEMCRCNILHQTTSLLCCFLRAVSVWMVVASLQMLHPGRLCLSAGDLLCLHWWPVIQKKVLFYMTFIVTVPLYPCHTHTHNAQADNPHSHATFIYSLCHHWKTNAAHFLVDIQQLSIVQS